MKQLAILFAGFLIATFALTTTSCQKNTDCVATVHCINSSGVAVNNAAVKLFATIKTAQGGTVIADVKANAVTDGGGEVKFTFKLPAIYDISATALAPDSVTGAYTRTITGTGIIKLVEGQGVDKIVTLQ